MTYKKKCLMMRTIATPRVRGGEREAVTEEEAAAVAVAVAVAVVVEGSLEEEVYSGTKAVNEEEEGLFTANTVN